MRKIPKTLALMSLLAPLGANALGIGDIRLHSALNQSLNAEIPLVTSGGEELSDIRVSLASAEAFARAGIERRYDLTKLRFSAQKSADGSYFIKVSSLSSISEPFLNFMIDVHWPQGRLQREFTVLLDPPDSPQSGADDENETELPGAVPYQRPEEQTARRPVPTEIAPIPRRAPRPAREVIASSAPPLPPAEEVPVTGKQYGPVNRNETLWGIAKEQNRDDSISQEKMLQAIYRANPQAFYKNSINALKAGETITIPDRDTIIRLTGTPSAAPQTLRTTGKLAAKPAIPATGSTAPSGEDTQGQLKLLAPSSSKTKGETASTGATGKSGKSKEDLGSDTSGAAKQENEAIRKSLAELKEQLSGIQRLLVLKDEQIAALQAQQKQPVKQPQQVAPTSPAVQPAQAVAPVAPPPNVEPAKAPVETAQAKIPPAAPSQPTTTAPTSTATPPKPIEAPPAAQAPTTPPKPVVKRPPAQAKPVQPPAPAKEEGILAEIMEHPTYYAIGGIIGGFGLAIWWIKRRRAAMIDETESILTLGDREKTFQPRKPAIALGQPPSGISEQSTVTTTSRSSFLSEFTPSDFDALGGEMEEVDPISEADVYLAYGRYKQAEELIRSAIAQNPERDECKLKLLEIHYATENSEAFEKFAETIASTHKESKPDFWEKVVEMGQELCPGSPLFGGAENAAPSQSFASHKAAGTMETAAHHVNDSNLFEQDSEDSYLPQQPSKQQAHPTEESSETISYDFFTTETPDSAFGEEAEDETDLQHLDNVISFDKTPASVSAGPVDSHDKTLDDILAELGVIKDAPVLTPVPETHEIDDGNGIDFDAEFKRMLEAEENSQFEEESSEQMPLTEMDEIETKLDLAKAYFDMGDDDAARVILENVAELGNDAQKEEAWSLLSRLTRKEVNRR